MPRSTVIVAVVVLTASSAGAQSRDLEEARRRFEAGSQAFAKKDYALAEQEFRAAFDITGDPILNFNIAEAQGLQGHYEDAIRSYQAYLAGVPAAEDRAEVERRIRDYEARLKAAGGTSAAPVKDTPPPGRGVRRTWAWASGGGALALAGVGVAMTALGKRAAADGNQLLSARDAQGLPLRFADVASRFNGYKDHAARFGEAGAAMYCLAAAAAGAAVYLFVTGKPARTVERRPARLHLTPALSWRAAGVAAGLAF